MYVFSLSFLPFRSSLLAAPVSTASTRVTPSPGRPALLCQQTQNAVVPRGLAWDSEHFMSLLPLPRPHARLSLQETRLSKWLTNRRGGDVAALECVTIPCPNLIWIMRIFLSVRSDGFTLNFYLWHRNIKICVPRLSDGRIIGGIDDQAFRSKLIRPDLLTKFWTLKQVMSDKKSFSHVHLDREHYRNDSDTKDSSKYLQIFWKLLKEKKNLRNMD